MSSWKSRIFLHKWVVFKCADQMNDSQNIGWLLNSGFVGIRSEDLAPEAVGINEVSDVRRVSCVAGARFEPPDAPSPGAAGLSLGEALDQFVTALQQSPPLPPPPDHATTSLLLQWLQVRLVSLCFNWPNAWISISLAWRGFIIFIRSIWQPQMRYSAKQRNSYYWE
jgi:hypothetical protein